jgi:RNA recognition motif-containing protein
MSLFIGNVSKKVTHQEFEDAFKGFGNCKIDLRVASSSPRSDTPSCSSRVSGVRSRPGRHCKTPTLADFASTSSGPRIQEGLTRTRDPKTNASIDAEVTSENAAGARKIASFAARLPLKKDTLPHTPITKMTSKHSSPSPPEMPSK